EEHGLKCCLYNRDFHPGRRFYDQMGESIESSRRVLCFLSQNFLQSEFCIWQFKHAFEEDQAHSKKRLLAVMLESVTDHEFD
ncbi:hypothetical protein CAPTEDRAFT_29758, partial [Capitella teleta]